MQQLQTGTCQPIYVHKEKVSIFVISQQTTVCQDTQCEDKPPLKTVTASLQLAQHISDYIIPHYTAKKEGKEIRASLGIKIKGCQNEPQLGTGMQLVMMQYKVSKKSNGKE